MHELDTAKAQLADATSQADTLNGSLDDAMTALDQTMVRLRQRLIQYLKLDDSKRWPLQMCLLCGFECRNGCTRLGYVEKSMSALVFYEWVEKLSIVGEKHHNEGEEQQSSTGTRNGNCLV